MNRATENILVERHCGHRADSIFDLAEYGLTERMNEWIRAWKAENPRTPLTVILDMKGAWNRRPAHWASECNQYEALASLLDFGASPRTRYKRKRDLPDPSEMNLGVRPYTWPSDAALIIVWLSY
jgi:hypothetical protein